MTLDVVCFGNRENGNRDKQTVREEAWGNCTVFDSFYDDEARSGSYEDYDGAIFSRYTVTGEMMARLKHARAVTRFGAGVDAIDSDAATEMGKLVVSTHTYGPETIAEHADRLLLSVRGWGPWIHEMVRDGIWTDRKTYLPDHPNPPTTQCTLGIVGLGEIGRCSAYRQQGKWQRILAYDPYPDPALELAQSGPVEYVEFPELLASSDAVIVHCAQTRAAVGMFDRGAFRRMKEGSFFVNVARGGVMVERDLVDALESGHLGGAGIDVFTEEPPEPGSPLLAYAGSEKGKNLVLSPHVAGLITRTARQNIVSHSYESLIRAVRLQLDHGLPWEKWPRSIINFELVRSYPAFGDWKRNAAPCLRWRLIEAGEL